MAPGKTIKLTVSNIAPTEIVTRTRTMLVRVYEDGNNTNHPTTTYSIMKPTQGDDAAGQPAGAVYEFSKSGTQNGYPTRYGMFEEGETVGFIQLPPDTPASSVFIQEEL